MKKYFPNNWAKIKDVPAEYFGDMPFEDFMHWRAVAWELPSSIDCIIREIDIESGKVKEYSYVRQKDAKKRVRKIMDEQKCEFLLATHETIHHMYPKEVGEEYEEGEYEYEDYE